MMAITKKRLIHYLSDHKNDPFSIAADVTDDNRITIGPNKDLTYVMLLMLDHKLAVFP